MTVRGRLEAWLATRSTRERHLLAAAAASTAALALAAAVQVVRDDLTTLRARIAAHERELGEVRQLAATLRHRAPHDPGDDAPLLGRLVPRQKRPSAATGSSA